METTMATLLPLRCILLTLLVLLLAACGQETESDADAASTEPVSTPDPEPAPEAESDLEALIDDPQALRQAIRDPERRDAVIAALRDQRGSDDARARLREKMRERREEILARQDGGERRAMSRGSPISARSEWWNDETVSGQLNLTAQQAAALSEAHLALQDSQMQSRQARAGSQRELLDAIGRADRNEIETMIERRSEAAIEQARAEAEWMQTLIDELDDEQLGTLAENFPQLLLQRL
jgi:Spy/CpxP family protein refolding chaperone